MYFYIYDNFLTERKYQPLLSRIETKLTDFGMSGKVVRMSVLKNLKSTISDNINDGVKSIVVIGNDKTLNQTINLIDNPLISIGYIPIGNNCNLARVLGIPEGENAINILSARLIENLHYGLINEHYKFLSYLELAGNNATINCDNDFYVTVNNPGDIITISNLYYGEFDDVLPISNNQNYISITVKPQNSTILKHKTEKFSYFKAANIRIESQKPQPILLIDEKTILKTPLTISGSKNTIRFIVGKQRKF